MIDDADRQAVLDVIHDEEDCPLSYASTEAILRALIAMDKGPLLRSLGMQKRNLAANVGTVYPGPGEGAPYADFDNVQAWVEP